MFGVKKISVACLLGVLLLPCSLVAQIPMNFWGGLPSLKGPQIVRESELFDLDEKLNLYGSYIFAADDVKCDSINGRRHGRYEAYDKIVKHNVIEGVYLYGKREGLWRWYDNGRLLVEGHYKDGVMDGEWHFYHTFSLLDSASTLVLSCTLDSGALEGNLSRYYFHTIRGEAASSWVPCRITEKYLDGEVVEVCALDSLDSISAKVVWQSPTKVEIYRKLAFGEEETSSCVVVDETIYGVERLVAANFKNDSSRLMKRKCGEYRLVDPNNKSITEGDYNDRNKKDGEWIVTYSQLEMKAIYQYHNDTLVSERYERINGKPYSGKLLTKDMEHQTQTLIGIKKGVRHGSSFVTRISDGATLNQKKYKKGIVIEETES